MSGGGASADRVPGGGFTLRAPPHLRLLPLEPEPPSAALLDWLAETLRARLPSEVTVAPAAAAERSWWSAERSQLSSNAIVDTLAARFAEPAGGFDEWVVGLTLADLRGGEREFVFGEAALGGGWAVVSSARLGAPGEPEFRLRLLKETLHEIGHLAGLAHCSDPHCLMAPSATVSGVDEKGADLCDRCRATALGGGP